MFKKLSVSLIAALLIMVSFTVPTQASSTDPDLPDTAYGQDITNTARGQALAKQSAGRFGGKLGRTVKVSELRVINLQDGTTLVAPKDGVYTLKEEALPDGKKQFSMQFNTPKKPMTLDEFSTMDISSYPLVASQCYDRYYVTGGHMDNCVKIHKYESLVQTSSGQRALYAMFHTAGGVSHTGWELHSMKIWGYNSYTGAIMDWSDWTPKDDTTGNCIQYQLTLSGQAGGQSGSGGASIELPIQRCETWDITKGVTAGNMQNEWRGDVEPGVDRSVGYGVEVLTNPNDRGGWPVWTLNWTMTTDEDLW